MLFISPDGNYPSYYGDIMLAHPGFEIGDEIPEGWRAVEMTEPPVLEKYQMIEAGEPEEIDGVLQQTWLVREMTQEEKDRVDAPENAKAKLLALGLTALEIQALSRGLV